MYNTKNECGFNQRMYTHLSQTENAFSVDRELGMHANPTLYIHLVQNACMHGGISCGPLDEQ